MMKDRRGECAIHSTTARVIPNTPRSEPGLLRGNRLTTGCSFFARPPFAPSAPIHQETDEEPKAVTRPSQTDIGRTVFKSRHSPAPPLLDLLKA
jgi:hypothetical protein